MARLTPRQRHRARRLRAEATDAERALWQHRRAAQLGARFRRQHPIGPFIADFACPARRLVVEVDGGQHAAAPTDATRDAWLAARGWRVLRFWNHDVLAQPDTVAEAIWQALHEPHG